jgi:hypothetical protein
LVEAVQRTQYLLAEERHVPAGFGELDAPAPGLEHRRSHGFGKAAEQTGDGWLRESQLVRGARDAAQAQARLERDELGTLRTR